MMYSYICKKCNSDIGLNRTGEYLECRGCGQRITDNLQVKMEKYKESITCPRCAATMRRNLSEELIVCDYCDTVYIREAYFDEINSKYDRIVTFKGTTDENVRERFYAAAAKEFAPHDFRQNAVIKKIDNVFLPFYRYKVFCDVSYSLEVGSENTRRVWDEKDKKYRDETYTVWSPISGNFRDNFVLITKGFQYGSVGLGSSGGSSGGNTTGGQGGGKTAVGSVGGASGRASGGSSTRSSGSAPARSSGSTAAGSSTSTTALRHFAAFAQDYMSGEIKYGGMRKFSPVLLDKHDVVSKISPETAFNAEGRSKLQSLITARIGSLYSLTRNIRFTNTEEITTTVCEIIPVSMVRYDYKNFKNRLLVLDGESGEYYKGFVPKSIVGNLIDIVKVLGPAALIGGAAVSGFLGLVGDFFSWLMLIALSLFGSFILWKWMNALQGTGGDKNSPQARSNRKANILYGLLTAGVLAVMLGIVISTWI